MKVTNHSSGNLNSLPVLLSHDFWKSFQRNMKTQKPAEWCGKFSECQRPPRLIWNQFTTSTFSGTFHTAACADSENTTASGVAVKMLMLQVNTLLTWQKLWEIDKKHKTAEKSPECVYIETCLFVSCWNS